MIRTMTLGGVALAILSSGCCWRPFLYGPSPTLFNPPPAPLFPRLHPSFWAQPQTAPIGAPAALPSGPDCPGCVGGLPPGAIPSGAMPPGAFPMSAGPVTVTPPSGPLAIGPQFSPTYFGPAPVTGATNAPAGSTQLPQPRTASDPPSAMPMK